MINEIVKKFLKPTELEKNSSSLVMPDNVMNDLSSDNFMNSGSFFDVGNNNNYFSNNETPDVTFKQRDKILKYRQVAMIPDVNDGIDEIVNEIIFSLNSDSPIKIQVDQENEKIQKSIIDAFEKIKKLMRLDRNLFNVVKQGYIDGQLVIHSSYDEKNKKKGITSIKMIDPCLFTFDPKENVYKYSETKSSFYTDTTIDILKYSPEEIVKDDFGLYADKLILSYLEYSIKPANILQTMEDLLIPMRFSRSISRRVFNVDIGDLPTKRGEELMTEYQNKFKYKRFYNSETGEVSNQQHITSMVEDYWFSNRGGGRGTEVSTIDESGNLGELNDILYFYKKLYKSMKIPLSRISMDPENDGNFDYESTQTSKDDIKFFMHISRLRKVYTNVLKQLLKRELIFTGVLSEDEWNELEETINIFFEHDNTFVEKMMLDNFVKKIEIFGTMQEQAGKLLPVEDIMKQVFKYSDKEIEDNFKKIEKESSNKLYKKFYAVEEDL